MPLLLSKRLSDHVTKRVHGAKSPATDTNIQRPRCFGPGLRATPSRDAVLLANRLVATDNPGAREHLVSRLDLILGTRWPLAIRALLQRDPVLTAWGAPSEDEATPTQE